MTVSRQEDGEAMPASTTDPNERNNPIERWEWEGGAVAADTDSAERVELPPAAGPGADAGEPAREGP
jgi:hypothetical protein